MKRRYFVLTLAVVLLLGFALATAASAQSAQPENPEPGLVIVRVDPDGPAADAGVKRGDILLAADDTEINSMMDWAHFIADHSAGDRITLTVMHGDDERDLRVTLDEQNGQPYVGIQPYADMMQMIQVQQPEVAGALIAEVTEDSPAADAGLVAGDRIMTVDDEEVTADNDLAAIIGALEPGDRVTLTVQNSAGEERTVRVRLGKNPDKAGAAYLGVRYSMTPAMPEGFNMDEMPFDMPQFRGGIPFGNGSDITEAQALVRSVAEDSPAATAGLQEGDRITAIDGETVADPAAVVDAISALKPGDTVTLTVVRDGEDNPIELEAKLGEHPDHAGRAYLGVELGAAIQIERFFRGGQPGQNPQDGFMLPFGNGNFQFRLDPSQLQDLFKQFQLPTPSVPSGTQPFDAQTL